MEQESNDSHIQFVKSEVLSSEEGLMSVSKRCTDPNVGLEDGPAVCFDFRHTGGVVLTCWRGRLQAGSLCHAVTLSETFPNSHVSIWSSGEVGACSLERIFLLEYVWLIPRAAAYKNENPPFRNLCFCFYNKLLIKCVVSSLVYVRAHLVSGWFQVEMWTLIA